MIRFHLIYTNNTQLFHPPAYKGVFFNYRPPLELPGLPYPRGAPASDISYELKPRFEEADVDRVQPSKIFFLTLVSMACFVAEFRRCCFSSHYVCIILTCRDELLRQLQNLVFVL